MFGEHGIVFLDVRGPRSLHLIEGEQYPYMGSLQWQEVKDALSESGLMRDVRSLLMICPAPIVFLPTTINDLLGNTVIDDALGHWSSKPFKAEQVMMLNLCQAWKAARPGRELTFVGGDVHVGGHSEITRDGVVVFQQLVTSAIANYILSRFEFVMGQLSQDLITELEEGWGFKHRLFTRERNYGVMTISADDVGPLVERHLVTPKGNMPYVDTHHRVPRPSLILHRALRSPAAVCVAQCGGQPTRPRAPQMNDEPRSRLLQCVGQRYPTAAI